MRAQFLLGLALVLSASTAYGQCDEAAEPQLEEITAIVNGRQCEIWTVNRVQLSDMDEVAAGAIVRVLCSVRQNSRNTVVQLFHADDFTVRYRILRGDRHIVEFIAATENVRHVKGALIVDHRKEPSEGYRARVAQYLSKTDLTTDDQREALQTADRHGAAIIRGVIDAAARDTEPTKIEFYDVQEYVVPFRIESGNSERLVTISQRLGMAIEMDDDTNGRFVIPMATR